MWKIERFVAHGKQWFNYPALLHHDTCICTYTGSSISGISAKSSKHRFNWQAAPRIYDDKGRTCPNINTGSRYVFVR